MDGFLDDEDHRDLLVVSDLEGVEIKFSLFIGMIARSQFVRNHKSIVFRLTTASLHQCWHRHIDVEQDFEINIAKPKPAPNQLLDAKTEAKYTFLCQKLIQINLSMPKLLKSKIMEYLWILEQNLNLEDL